MARICCICGKKLGLRVIMIKNHEYACFDCVKAAGHNPMTWLGNLKTSKDEMKQSIESGGISQTFSMPQTINVTHSVENVFKVDEENQLWYAQDMFGLHKTPIHKFEDILDFELLEDGNIITKGGLGSALVGGLTFGGVGAVVGATTGKKTSSSNCTSMRIKITLNSLSCPVEYIDLISMKVSKKSAAYKNAFDQAQQILSMLQIIIQNRKTAD